MSISLIFHKLSQVSQNTISNLSAIALMIVMMTIKNDDDDDECGDGDGDK